MMNRIYDTIRFAMLLLLAAGGFYSCRQDDYDEFDDPQALIAEGRYLSSAVAEPRVGQVSQFEVGTPYRLLAFTKPYKADGSNDAALATYPRFSTVAWEGGVPGTRQYVNLESEPEKWLGFPALGSEPAGDNGLVSLDFYGFTYGEPLAERPADYIALDDVGAATPTTSTALSSLKRTETVADATDAAGSVIAEGAELSDLMRGELLNQNYTTVGQSGTGTQSSVLPFSHCFSKLRFKAFQQMEDNGDPCFTDIVVEKVVVTDTYTKGSVYLQGGKVEIDPAQVSTLAKGDEKRRRELKLTSTAPVSTTEVTIGEMIVFPSDGNSLTNTALAEGYDVGLEITVTGADEGEMRNFLVNNGSLSTLKKLDNGRWEGTIRQDRIIDYTDPDKKKTLYFRQNTLYTLVLWFVRDAVRIIVVVPQVEPWVDGEGTTDDPWEDQALGQPQMFDNIVWSDRNLGATDVRPTDGFSFERSVGYFYQAGRNIPYYPFDTNVYTDGRIPPFDENMSKQNFVDKNTDWGSSHFQFYPIVDERIRKMKGGLYGNWTMNRSGGATPQMMIPEEKPTGESYFNFLGATSSDTRNGLTAAEDMHWEKALHNQPVDGLWRLPSAKEFATIFPTIPHAGNIIFNKVREFGDNANNWGCDGTHVAPDFLIPKKADGGTDVLRVTVPFYAPGEACLRPKNAKYIAAWKTLAEHVNEEGELCEEGTTHLDVYGGGHPGNPEYAEKFEPDGDPEPGFASTYIISRAGDDLVQLKELKDRFVVKEWGTIYAIKRVYTDQAYRMRWRAQIVKEGTMNPCICIEVCRYRCSATDELTEENYKDYDWDHPAARIYFPVGGMGDWDGKYINFGTECAYATSDAIYKDGTVNALRIKLTGNNASNAYIAIVRGSTNRNFGMQIRPVIRDGSRPIQPAQ